MDRYIDWSITVPLQMIEFNLILKAAGKETSSGMFWRLLVGTVMMLLFGYLGEISAIPAHIGFYLGMTGWAFILFEIFCGEAGGSVKGCSAAVATAFNYMRLIVTVGWAIYPAGYWFGYLLGAVDETFLNVIYNIADFVNKIAFVLSCWSCAKADTAKDALLAWSLRRVVLSKVFGQRMRSRVAYALSQKHACCQFSAFGWLQLIRKVTRHPSQSGSQGGMQRTVRACRAP